jgi:hypothetical protein
MNAFPRRGLLFPVVLSLACGATDPGPDSSSAGSTAQPGGQQLPGAGGSGVQLPGTGLPPVGAGGTSGTGETPTGNVPLQNPPTTGTGGTGTGAGGSSSTTTPPVAGMGGSAPVVPQNVRELYVSATGSDTNPGTLEQPFASLGRAATFAQPGFTIFILPGTLVYGATQVLNVNGAQGNLINVVPATAGTRPVLDFIEQPREDNASRGIEIPGSFWHIQGLDVRNAGDNGIHISGSNNIIEDVIVHNNGDTGLQITAPEAQATNGALASNNLVLNCDSFGNFDPANNGENADGFAAKLRIGPGNVFRGCRAWNNADDGWDFFASDDVVTIEDSWAFLNGIVAGGGNSAGDGNGFKLGGAPNGVGQGHAPHIVRGGAAFDNRTCGFTINNNEEEPVLSDCGIGGNDTDYCGLDCNGEFDVGISGAQAITQPRNADGSLPSLD